ncbi:MAG: cytochrome c oxidase accessory protein CcoG [Gemmatimonadota bacterium]
MIGLLHKLGFAEGARAWVYPQSIRGRFQRLHRLSGWILLAILLGVPWIRLGGHPLLLFDIADRRLYAFGAIFTAADAILVLLLLLTLAFSLFFFTSLFGRLWCGYGCPQTVFLEELIRPIEKWIEGDRNVRMRRDAGPLTADRVRRKLLKWAAFALIAGVGAMSMTGYFVPAEALWTGQAPGFAYAATALNAAVGFLDFAWFREQFCIYVCPYARFQSVMTDAHTLQITYDRARGEPRGGPDAKKDGRCVACNLCVTVCPTGIDIRNGYQLECIGCARCIDACDQVMGRLGHRGLVVYTTEAETRGEPRRILRPRPLVYGGLISAFVVAAAVIVTRHVSFEAELVRSPGSTFVIDTDGAVRNTFLLTIANNDPHPEPTAYTVSVHGLPGAELVAQPIVLKSTEDRTVPVVVRIPRDDGPARAIPFRVEVASPREQRTIHATFMTPGHRQDEAEERPHGRE